MTDKQSAIETVQRLPDDATLEEIQTELAILAGLRRTEDDIDAGRYVPHEAVKRRIAEWLSK